MVLRLSNAIKFTDKGSITVSARQIDAEFIMVDVQDTWIGIAEEDQANIFGEFWQVEQTNDRRYTGTGLGLSICRQLIELHGGTLTLESELGSGSTFRFTVPIADAPEMGRISNHTSYETKQVTS